MSKRTVRPIGAYLADQRPGAARDIEKALDTQGSFEKQGVYKPLGSILAGAEGIDEADLDASLRAQRTDILGSVELFSSLPPEVLHKLANTLTTRILSAGEVVFRQTAPGEAFYVVVSGSVRILRSDPDGTVVVLSHRGPGEGFGEIAVLTNGPHSSSAETTTRTSLLAIPKDVFLETVFSHPTSAMTAARTLAERLSRGYDMIVDATAAEQAYRQFIVDQLRRDEPLFIGTSQAVMKLIREIGTLAGSSGPVLVRGEPGAEMKDVAGLIHDMARDGAGMLLSLDATACDSAAPGTGGSDLFTELNQSGTLFGRGRNAIPFAPDRRLGLLTMAAGGAVVIENVEFLAPRIQERLAEYLETGVFTAIGEPGAIRSDARIIATSSADLGALAGTGAFDRRLERMLSARVITVPPLRKRKQDIAITADELIKRSNRMLGKHVSGMDEEAYHSLVNYDWPGNTEELRTVIRRAVSIAQGRSLSVEDIFIGPPPVTGKYAIDLLAFPPVRKLFLNRLYPKATHLVTIPFIAVIIGLGMFGSQSPDSNLALILTWGLWEPTLVLSALFTGRAWCSVCPIGAVSALVRKFAGRNYKVPLWIRNRGFYFTAAGIALIFWLEAVFDMPSSPFATAMLVIPLVLLAGLAGFLFQRRTWCRYLCPLGGMMGVFAGASVLEMRSNYGICNSTCLKHECYAGTDDREGCPMFEGPFALSSNRTCVLCGNCVKVCPNHSPVLNLRLPGYELWTQRAPDTAFGVITIALMGTQFFRGIGLFGFPAAVRENAFSWWGGTFALLIGTALIAWLFSSLAGRVAFGPRQSGATNATLRISYALLPLVFAFEAALHLERFLLLAGQFLPVLGRQLGLSHELPGIIAPTAVVLIAQVLLVAAGTAGSAAVLRNILKTSLLEHAHLLRRSWPIIVLAAVYLAVFMAR
ncbi:MAG: cyclic nucleotide-binding domain-containing protein [Nitrospirota bacterium]|nr:cyclic nucleotide-binding domain-containing protein [Nitrospirota bacterium]